MVKRERPKILKGARGRVKVVFIEGGATDNCERTAGPRKRGGLNRRRKGTHFVREKKTGEGGRKPP